MKSFQIRPSLRVWRAAKGINQTEAAKILGISQQHYSRIEKGFAISRPLAKVIEREIGLLIPPQDEVRA